MRVPEQSRRSKWDRKADLGILLGYTEVGYRVLVNNKIIITRHVDIVEENVKCIGLTENDSENEYSDDSKYDSVESESEVKVKVKEEDTKNEEIVEKEQAQQLRKSTREKKMPSRFDAHSNFIYVNFCSADSPVNFEEAINSNESENWIQAMNREIECLNKNLEISRKTRKQNCSRCEVGLHKKSEHKYKARLIVRDFQQKEVVDDIYFPVAKMQTLKILLSYCCQEGSIIEQMDVETAFLNGKVSSESYVKQTRGYK